MPRVFIPPAMRSLTAGQAEVQVDGGTLREVIDGLEKLHPGTRSQLCRGDQIRPGLMVGVDTSVASSGLHTVLKPDSEVHFLPAIGGG